MKVTIYSFTQASHSRAIVVFAITQIVTQRYRIQPWLKIQEIARILFIKTTSLLRRSIMTNLINIKMFVLFDDDNGL